MDNPLFVNILQGYDDAGDEKSRLLLPEFSLTSNMVPEISSVAIIHNQVKSLLVLESKYHIDQKRMFQLFKESFFVHDRVH